jgi:peptidoglycan/xylan/chitin deacetylase (PgdA/CDA1 family)
MKLFRPVWISGWLYPEALFRLNTRDKILCLTFDDGPDPESTVKILEILEKHIIKAVFFCNGRAAEMYPDLVERIRQKGHLIGNHGYNHINGWTTSAKLYCNDVNHASRFTSGKLFRPPYGYLRMNQYLILRRSFKIVFWDLMPYDFDKTVGAVRSLEILKNGIRPGSIIVLHDSRYSASLFLLDEFLDRTIKGGYSFSYSELQ